MNKFQIAYLLTFLISLIGIAGNIELEITTPITSWVILGISSFFNIRKIYICRKEEIVCQKKKEMHLINAEK